MTTPATLPDHGVLDAALTAYEQAVADYGQAATDALTAAQGTIADLQAQIAHQQPPPAPAAPAVSLFAGFKQAGGTVGWALPNTFKGGGKYADVHRLAARSSQYTTEQISPSNTTRLFAARVDGDGVNLADFAIEAGGQLHRFHGLAVYNSKNAVLRRISSRGASSSTGGSPPDECFELALQATDGILLEDLDLVGGDRCGSVLGANNQNGLTANRCRFTGAVYANGATFWKTTGQVTLTDCDLSGNFKPFNSENSTAQFHLIRPVLRNYRNSSAIVVRGALGSSKVLIEDPVHDGPLPIWLGGTLYNGKPNLQKTGDVTVLVGGKDVTGDKAHVVFV